MQWFPLVSLNVLGCLAINARILVLSLIPPQIRTLMLNTHYNVKDSLQCRTVSSTRPSDDPSQCHLLAVQRGLVRQSSNACPDIPCLSRLRSKQSIPSSPYVTYCSDGHKIPPFASERSLANAWNKRDDAMDPRN